MADTICFHCGYRNPWEESYCQNCGALLLPADEGGSAPNPPRQDTAAETSPPALSAPDLPSLSDQGRREHRFSPETSVGIGHLAGLIPERSQWENFPYQETASQPHSPPGIDPIQTDLPTLTLESASPSTRITGNAASMTLRRQSFLYWLLFLAALIPFWLDTADREQSPPAWEGVEETHWQLAALEPASNVLVYWQNEPAFAGELDLASGPILQALLSAGINIHVLTQHPLGLQHLNTVLDTVKSDLQTSAVLNTELADPNTLVHVLGFWPGGYVVLPSIEAWLQSTRPDLQLIITPHIADVLHWLELVAPFADAPVVVITSAGTGQVLRPYLDTGQITALISGYDGAYQYAKSTGLLLPTQYGSRMGLHFVVQNWVTACLVLVILITILFRGQGTIP